MIIRLSILLSISVVLVAIVTGGLIDDASVRTPGRLRLVGLAPQIEHQTPRRALDLLETDQGRLLALDVSRTEAIDMVSGTPWTDLWGDYRLVGRWRQCAGANHSRVLQACGLAKIAYPSGRVLERVPLEVFPIAPPCWMNGPSETVLFVGGDTALYRYRFDNARTRAPNEEPLVRLRWEATPPGAGAPQIRDVHQDPSMPEDLVLVSLAVRRHAPGNNRFQPTRIWWLRLDQDRAAIVDHGPITSEDGSLMAHHRHPSLHRQPDGSIALTYLERFERNGRSNLRLARVASAGTLESPRLLPGTDQVLALNCLTSPTGFSSDGRWITGLTGPARNPQVFRVPTDPDLIAALRWLPGFAPVSIGSRDADETRARSSRGLTMARPQPSDFHSSSDSFR